MAIAIHSWMRDELERRKDLTRRLWAGQPVERIPVDVRVRPPAAYSVREQVRDANKQLEVALDAALMTWQRAPSSDGIPAMRPDVGCASLASAYGVQYYWGDDPEQTPGAIHLMPPGADVDAWVDALPSPDPARDGWLPEGIRRVRLFAEAGEGLIPTAMIDMAGGLNVASDLMGMTELLTALYTAPGAIHLLLHGIQELFAATIRACLEAAGGEERITNTDYLTIWYPEGLKGHVSDDVCAGFGPRLYEEFSAPYHARILQEFGAGGLHNCGPHPCHAAYVAHEVSPRSFNFPDSFSHGDLPNLKVSFKKKAFIHLAWNGTGDPVAWYRDIMELMAPDVIVAPLINLQPEDDPEGVVRALRPIAEEYARRMDWGWERPAVRRAG
ncbi:MAG: uroporphyrinogen decarboxylase/cobalamine-independent methonine synthase family protein [Anaerolineae bacterium]